MTALPPANLPPATVPPENVPVVAVSDRLDRNPAAVYLAGKPSAAGRRGLQRSLDRAAEILTGGLSTSALAVVGTTQRYDRRPEEAKRKAAELLHVPQTNDPNRFPAVVCRGSRWPPVLRCGLPRVIDQFPSRARTYGPARCLYPLYRRAEAITCTQQYTGNALEGTICYLSGDCRATVFGPRSGRFTVY